MPDCEYKVEKNKERRCGILSSETICDGNFSCDEEGRCTLSVPCGQTMTFDVSLLNARTLCHGALQYECKDRNKWLQRCDPKFLGGAIQFSSTDVKDCMSLVNQGRYNKDGMDCRCKICDYAGCGSDKLFCDCSVETYPLPESTTPNDVGTTHEDNFNKDYLSATNVSRGEQTTSISLISQSTVMLPSQKTWASAETTMETNTVTYTAKPVPQDNGFTVGLLGGIIGGIVALLAIGIIAFVSHKRCRKGKTGNKSNVRRNPSISFMHTEDQVTVQSVVNAQEPEREDGAISVRGQICTSHIGNRSDDPQNCFYTSLTDNRSDGHVYDTVVKSSQNSLYMTMTSTDPPEGFYTSLSENRNYTSIYDKIRN